MDELFRLYTAERQQMQKSHISINLVVKEELMYSVLENVYGCNKSKLDCIITQMNLV
jgi:S-adenosylhomocysteine hydrolase